MGKGAKLFNVGLFGNMLHKLLRTSLEMLNMAVSVFHSPIKETIVVRVPIRKYYSIITTAPVVLWQTTSMS